MPLLPECLPCTQEDRNSIPKAPVKKPHCGVCFPPEEAEPGRSIEIAGGSFVTGTKPVRDRVMKGKVGGS